MPLRSPDAIAREMVFTPEVKDRSPYEAWLASKGVSTPDSPEMVIAWQLAKVIHVRPTALIRALRGQQGDTAGLVERVQRIVEANPSIEFQVDETGVQRTVFTEGSDASG